MFEDHPILRLDHRFMFVQRSRQLIARVLDLDDKEYRLWDLFSTLPVYKPSKPEQDNIVRINDIQLSQVLGKGWSTATVSRVRRRLQEKLVIEKIEEETYRVLIMMERNVPAILQDQISELKLEIARLQVAPEENHTYSNNSNKSRYVSKPVLAGPKVRTAVEYQTILSEGRFPGMNVSDLQFIDGQKFGDAAPGILH